MMAEQASRVAVRALACMDELIKMYEGDEVVKHWHEQADFKVRRQKRPDYYAILGVSSVASEPEIKAAYKQKALITHPDKHADSDEATRKTAEEEFKKIGASQPQSCHGHQTCVF